MKTFLASLVGLMGLIIAAVTWQQRASAADLRPAVAPAESGHFCPYLRGETRELTFESHAMSETIHCLVHLPPCYDDLPQRALPVVYLFHGWPMDEHHWVTLGVTELADDWVSRGIAAPFILVFPGADPKGRYVHSSGGDASFEGMIVNELVPRIDATYHTWRSPAGRAVGGISRGGVWSLEIGLRHPEIFGIVGAHSPALAQNEAPAVYDPFNLAQDPTDQRLYLDAGDKDWARAKTIKLRDVLRKQGDDVTYQVHSGKHLDSLWRGGLVDYLSFYTKTWPHTLISLPHWHESPTLPTDVTP